MVSSSCSSSCSSSAAVVAFVAVVAVVAEVVVVVRRRPLLIFVCYVCVMSHVFPMVLQVVLCYAMSCIAMLFEVPCHVRVGDVT